MKYADLLKQGTLARRLESVRAMRATLRDSLKQQSVNWTMNNITLDEVDGRPLIEHQIDFLGNVEKALRHQLSELGVDLGEEGHA